MTTTVLERTLQLVPELRARAEQANADRRLPEENIKALRQAGSFKVLQSSRNGGLGLGVRDHLDVISTLARGCASTAWVAGSCTPIHGCSRTSPLRVKTTSTATIPTPWCRR